MDARRALPFLLLVICLTNVAFAIQNGWSGSNNIRRIRRINEYLVPPPPPRFHPPGRSPRLANSPTQQGYFTQFMNWLYPSSSSSQPPLPPPLPSEPKTPLYPPPQFVQPAPPPHGPPATIYHGPTPVVYEKPPLPPSSINDQSGYPSSAKAKTCNSCNRVPWMPIHHGEPTHSGDASYAPPPPPPPLSPQSSLNNGYLPPRNNHEVPYDAHHAASQEVRASDFSFAPPLPAGEQGGTFISPLPNPHLYPGAIPPLFKAEAFNSVQITSNENLGYLNTPPSAVSGDGAPIENGSFLTGPVFNGEHNGQSVYSGPSGHSGPGVVHQELGYTNSGASNGEFNHFHQDHGAHSDLSSSGTQVSHGHVNPIPDKQGLGDTANSINHQPPLGSSDVRHRQPSEVSNDGEFYESTGSSGLPGNFLDNTNQNLPSSYGISGLDQVPNNYEGPYNDLSSSANVAEGSHVPLHASDGSSAKIEDSINFEESPLLDFTRKGESRTHSSSIPSTSNAFASFESAGTTVTSGNQIFGTRQNIASTESHLPTNYFETNDTVVSSKKSKINNSATQKTNENLYNPTTFREKDVSYIPPSDKAEYLWGSSFPTITTGVDRESFQNILKLDDDVAEETLNYNVNVNLNETSVRQQGAKRNKKIQVIIPYTSEHTPFPFRPSYERKISNTSETNRDDYVGEESRSRINVASPPNSSHIFPTWPTSLEKTTKKPDGTKPNNSIDIHRLQKNIDNWTIKEYSKGTTASTISPSSVNPYLYPSKKIPHEYLTTTETVNHVDDSHDDNVNTFTLSGFSFDDPEYKDSASNRVVGPRVQVIKVEKSTESSTDTSTASMNEDIWHISSVGISPVNKERVYVVTPQPTITTPRSYPTEQRKEKAKEADRNTKESRKALETDVKETKKSDTFESIESAYQVLPQAVNNLAVASTGPESVPLWGIMEHEEFASPNDGEHNNEDTKSLENPVLYSGHSKVSRARR